MKKTYTPSRKDIVYIDFDPTLGHEQAKRRPALVLSHTEYAHTVGLCLIVPMTSIQKNYPWEVSFSGSVSGWFLADQVRTVDFSMRNISFIEVCPDATFDTVLSRMLLLVK